MNNGVQNEHLERGCRGTDKTIKKIHQLIALGKLDSTIQKIASHIRLSVPGDERGRSRELADAVFHWVKDHGVFQRDPFQIEQVEHPLATMRPVLEARQAGAYTGPGLFRCDCDGYAIWVGALGGVLGFQYSMGTAKTDPTRPDEFSHIWAELLVNGEWVAYDASTPEATPGWRPPVPEKQFQRWDEGPIEEVVGMSGLGEGADGLGYWEDEPGYFPEDYVGYGVPKFAGNGAPRVPDVSAGELDVHIPRIPARPYGEMENRQDLKYTKKVRKPGPSSRPLMDQTEDHFPRPKYEPQKPFYHVRQGHPPGAFWAEQVAGERGKPNHESSKPYFHTREEYPSFRDKRVIMGQPRLVNGMGDVVMAPPKYLKHAGYEGMGEYYPEFQAKLRAIDQSTPEGKEARAALFEEEAPLQRDHGDQITAMDMEERAKLLRAQAKAQREASASTVVGQVEQAGSEVFNTALETLKALATIYGAAWYQREVGKLKDTVGAATDRVKNESGEVSTSWYEEPAVLAAGAAVVGLGVWYVATR